MRRIYLVLGLLAAPACSSRPDPFAPVPECKPMTLAVTPLKGDRQLLISSLKIAQYNEGFDLNLDGTVDNKLAPLGSVANSAIMQAFQFDHNIIIPIEMWGYTGPDSDCTKFAFYLGRYNEDKDGDGKDTTWSAGKSDCDDTNPMVHPGMPEDLMNRLDDDCDGFADNMSKGVAPADTMDMDGDGVSLHDGDCDDRPGNPMAKMRHKGAMDICGDGIDEDCDGIVDNDPSCDPFKQNKVSVHAQQLSFDPASMKPLIVFPDGNVKNHVLAAGPDLFSLSIPFQSDINVKLTLSGAHVKMTLAESITPAGTNATDGLLGGVLEAVSLAQIKGINAGGVIKPEQSLLDAIFAGPAATILGLDADNDNHYHPDIDVDGDGIESFWQEDTSKMPAIVDTCKDGDGKVYHNAADGTSCALMKDAKGNYMFPDGLSAALKFTAVPVTITDITAK